MRKNLLFTTAIVVYCMQASAQLGKGKFYTGISSENRFYFNNKSYGIKPELAYALDQHSSVGINFNYSRSSKYEIHYLDNARACNVQFGAGISYNYFRYFKNSNKLGWYASANLGFGRYKSYDIKYSGETVLNSQFNQTEFSIRPGIFYTPSPRITFFANVGGVSLNRSNGSFSGDFNFGSQLNIGMLINLDVFRKRK